MAVGEQLRQMPRGGTLAEYLKSKEAQCNCIMGEEGKHGWMESERK